MEATYFEPYEFRLNLNSFLQEARNVTFILQKNKKNIADFDNWYASWRDRLLKDPVLFWAKESRNRITKEGDLDTESYNLVSFITDWTDEMTRQFEAKASVPSTVLVRHALAQLQSELISEESLFCIERRWVDKNLPDRELLGATSHVLIILCELLEDAHAFIRAGSGTACEQFEKLLKMRSEYPFELANAEESRKVWVRAENLQRIRYDLRKFSTTLPPPDAVEERYGAAPELPEEIQTETLDGAVTFCLERAKGLLKHDKHLASFVFALSSDHKSSIALQLAIEDRAGKHIAIRRVASFLSRQRIEWALLVGESWLASYDPSVPLTQHAAQLPNRREAITVQGVSANGNFCNRYVEFSRRGDTIVFGDEKANRNPVNIMLPILKAIQQVSG
jgi:hypothetical protein